MRIWSVFLCLVPTARMLDNSLSKPSHSLDSETKITSVPFKWIRPTACQPCVDAVQLHDDSRHVASEVVELSINVPALNTCDFDAVHQSWSAIGQFYYHSRLFFVKSSNMPKRLELNNARRVRNAVFHVVVRRTRNAERNIQSCDCI